MEILIALIILGWLFRGSASQRKVMARKAQDWANHLERMDVLR